MGTVRDKTVHNACRAVGHGAGKKAERTLDDRGSGCPLRKGK